MNSDFHLIYTAILDSFSGKNNGQVYSVRCEKFDGQLPGTLEAHSSWYELSLPVSVQHGHRRFQYSYLLQMVKNRPFVFQFIS